MFLVRASIILSVLVVFTSASGCAKVKANAESCNECEDLLIMSLVTQGADHVTPVDSDKHSREDCPTGGWVGDGTVRTRCLECDPPYSANEQLVDNIKPKAEVAAPVQKRSVDTAVQMPQDVVKKKMVNTANRPWRITRGIAC